MSKIRPPFTPGQRHEITLAPGVTLALRYIPPGEFRMGSRGGNRIEEPVHRVTIEHGFWMGETPVTQEQFAVWTSAVGEEHENGCLESPKLPAERLDWTQAVRFCAWLAARRDLKWPTGKWQPSLPTEAEWEYACRAGTETEYFNGDGDAAMVEMGWCDGNADDGTQEVGEKAANKYGLHDMHGNVWEWCHGFSGVDWRNADPVYRQAVDGAGDSGVVQRASDMAAAAAFGAAPQTLREISREDPRKHVLRGGSWVDDAMGCTSARRCVDPIGAQFGNRGFRLCLAPRPGGSQRGNGKAQRGGGEGSGRRKARDEPGVESDQRR